MFLHFLIERGKNRKWKSRTNREWRWPFNSTAVLDANPARLEHRTST
uniref:Uncharacterized protein n=1 Tax=Anopheles christyi TaxID=43041 RepID=A0A182KIT7_9DIPT